MKLIFVNGTTSTGKTTLARKLSKDLSIPVFHRDVYKENRFDQLNRNPLYKDLSSIDHDSQKEMIKTIDEAIKNGQSLVVENNFTRTQLGKIKRLLKSNVTVVEIFLYANGFRVFKRYVSRYQTDERHKGHRDYLWYPIVAVEAFGLGHLRYRPLKLSSNLKIVNTNDFNKVDYNSILKFVRNVK